MINWKKIHKSVPASVKIGKHDYRILWITEFPKDCTQLGETAFGDEKQIVINLNQSIKELIYTLYHEILHAISFEYNANLTEKQVLAMEKSLRDVINICSIFTKDVNSATYKKKRRNSTKIRRTR